MKIFPGVLVSLNSEVAMVFSFAISMPIWCTNVLVSLNVQLGVMGMIMCKPFLPEVFINGVSPMWQSLSFRSSAISVASFIVAGASGSISKKRRSGCSMSLRLENGMWISSADRFASQIRVSMSLQIM